MPSTKTIEDYKDIEAKNSTLDLENKALRNEMEKMKQSADSNDDLKKKVEQATASNEELKKKMTEQAATLQAMTESTKTKEEKDKAEMASKIAKSKVAMGDLDEKDAEGHAKDLAKDHSARSLQAMFTLAEGASKLYTENKQAKLALENPAKAYRFVLPNGAAPPAKQASQQPSEADASVAQSLKDVRGGLY